MGVPIGSDPPFPTASATWFYLGVSGLTNDFNRSTPSIDRHDVGMSCLVDYSFYFLFFSIWKNTKMLFIYLFFARVQSDSSIIQYARRQWQNRIETKQTFRMFVYRQFIRRQTTCLICFWTVDWNCCANKKRTLQWRRIFQLEFFYIDRWWHLFSVLFFSIVLFLTPVTMTTEMDAE